MAEISNREKLKDQMSYLKHLSEDSNRCLNIISRMSDNDLYYPVHERAIFKRVRLEMNRIMREIENNIYGR